MTEGEKVRLQAIVEGRVQGVGFRGFVVDKANDLELTGWVRNRWDGSVEVVAESNQTTLDKLLGTLRKGPRAAYVTQVKSEWQTATGEFYGFSVRSTY